MRSTDQDQIAEGVWYAMVIIAWLLLAGALLTA